MPWKRSEVRRLASVTSPWRSTSDSRSLEALLEPRLGPLQRGLAVDQARRRPVGQQHPLGRAHAAQRDPEGHAEHQCDHRPGARGDRDHQTLTSIRS